MLCFSKNAKNVSSVPRFILFLNASFYHNNEREEKSETFFARQRNKNIFFPFPIHFCRFVFLRQRNILNSIGRFTSPAETHFDSHLLSSHTRFGASFFPGISKQNILPRMIINARRIFGLESILLRSIIATIAFACTHTKAFNIL